MIGLRAVRYLALVLAAVGIVRAEPGGAPSTLPQARVVQPMHTAPIGQIRADARFERLVTVSGDKTVRIWRLDNLQPLRTVYLPSEPGPEGTPNALAVSPDGLTIYAAGYTGWQWHKASHIVVIDAATGRITRTLGNFDDEIVTALDLSPDGGRLAVGLGRGGLVVLNPANGARIRVDGEYAGPVSFLHHASDGRLASASSDGCLRVYAADGRLVHRTQYPPIPLDQPQCRGGADLGGVRFSPDGRWLALGIRYLEVAGKELAALPLFDAQTLQLRRTLRVQDPNQRSLCCIAWSPDSRTLFLSGVVRSDESTPIYRIRDPATGEPERWDVGRQGIANMLPLPDGSILFATTVPSIVHVGDDGRIVRNSDGSDARVTPANVDFHVTRASPGKFLASSDGRSISFQVGAQRWITSRPMQASTAGALVKTDDAAPDMFPAVRGAPAMAVEVTTGDFSHHHPLRINGFDVKLNPDEDVHSWATQSNPKALALGTQWRLLMLDARGVALPNWSNPPFLPAPAFHTLLTRDGRFVIVALGDGTIRWFDIASGRERLGLFVDVQSDEWVVWRPDGYYASSPRGDRYIGWLINRGEAQSPDFYRAVQFERELYRPDLVRKTLDSHAGDAGQIQRLAAILKSLAAPRVAIESVTPGDAPGRLAVKFSAQANGRPIREVGVYIDDIPVLAPMERSVAGASANTLSRTVVARVTSNTPVVRVEAESDLALGVDETAPIASVSVPGASAARPGRLWVVAAGISRFDNLSEQPSLPFTTNDAVELAGIFDAQKGKAFSAVTVLLLTEGLGKAPTKANILGSLRDLDAIQADDTLIVFIASHGVTDGAEYYVVTKDAGAADINRLLQAVGTRTTVSRSSVPSLLSGSDLTAALRRYPGRRILILDTCFAASGSSSDPYSLIKRSASSQLAILAASSGDESSYEYPTRRHGVFTAAMIDALNGTLGASTARVSLQRAFDTAAPAVQTMLSELRRGSGNVKEQATIRQTPVLVAPKSLLDSVLIGR